AQGPARARACLHNTICRVACFNAPLDQNHPVTARALAADGQPATGVSPSTSGRMLEGRATGTWWRDPLVRSVRPSSQPFEDGLVLTLYGMVPRWGPGWWIDHPSSSRTREE